MTERDNIRWGWLKAMYIYTVLGGGGEEFPGLEELVPEMGPEKIMAMSYDEIWRILAPKY
jgi:hypothetical protein